LSAGDPPCRNTLQRTATLWTTMQHTATHCSRLLCATAPQTTYCTTLHHTVTHYSTLLHTATRCNTLLHTATHCDTLRHTPWPSTVFFDFFESHAPPMTVSCLTYSRKTRVITLPPPAILMRTPTLYNIDVDSIWEYITSSSHVVIYVCTHTNRYICTYEYVCIYIYVYI